MQILTNHRPRSHITTTATNDSALWFSITARFPNTVVISYNIGVISSTNDATSEDELFILKIERVTVIFMSQVRQNLNFLKNLKSQNLAQFLRLGSEFLHVISISIEFQTIIATWCLSQLLY